MQRSLAILAILAMFLPASTAQADTNDLFTWPTAKMQTRPWTRWWWLGSAVDEAEITRQLQQLHDAGFGGVEICPIYGAKGYEQRYIDFLSSRWVQMVAHTIREAKRLDMGVDLTTGTGWPFGGPQVTPQFASAKLVLKSYDIAAGAKLDELLPAGTVQCVRAVSDAGQQLDVTDHAKDRRLAWTAPPGAGKWRVYVVAEVAPIQKVKRAAPGGEGNVLDPYSPAAMDAYLAAFDRAFAAVEQMPMPRAEFHDSFEYYGANWTSDFFDEFQRRRGYDVRKQLPAMFGDGAAETVARVKDDYRATISELHIAYIQRWAEWSHRHGSIARNQAHGAPANLIDAYAAADIPETESFGPTDERNIPMHKFASSAAHLTGKPLSSSESFTWLGEHFQVSLGDVKPVADFLFLTGVNHIFFHGTPYSPKDVPWPGWLFYAAVNFGPNGGLWHDLPAFNAYLAVCQSILQSGEPDNDLLLYWPMHDLWQSSDGLLKPLTVHDQSKWLWPTSFHALAMKLWTRGYAFDEISDALLAQATCDETGRVRVGGNSYRAVIIPTAHVMPVATMQKLAELSRHGATILVQGELPSDVPGFADAQRRRDELLDAVKAGRFIVEQDVDSLLARSGARREAMVDVGLQFIRRLRDDGGVDYFIVNRSDHAIDQWLTLATPFRLAVMLDPLSDAAAALAATREGSQIYLQLEPGESRIIRLSNDEHLNGERSPVWHAAGEARPIEGTWRVQFIEGGPALPEAFDTDHLASWTTLGDAEAKRFAGTARYRIDFDLPADAHADEWGLDLGKVCESARVRLNGRDIATLFCPPFHVNAGASLRVGRNTLEIDVTNLAANRIADLDRRAVSWKAFHEINFVNKDYRPFDASHWPLRDSGLLGPIRLMPLRKFDPQTTAETKGER